MDLPINASDVRAAAERIRPLARRTPVLLDERDGLRIFFKCENLQRGGSFKIRGAANLIGSLAPEALARGIVAFSSGNHAQAVAIAAKHAGAEATIVMPDDAPRVKLDATRSYGARVVLYNRQTERREEIAARLLESTGATLVPPFDHPMIMAGQGTAALELLEETGPLDALVTPVGGGGLLAGSSTIAQELQPGIRIFGAEPAQANDTFLSLAAGRRITIHPDTVADGLRAPTPGELTFPVIRQRIEGILLASEEQIRAAVSYLLNWMKILAEPSGAVPIAAILAGALPEGIRSVGVIISGGNIDLEDLKTYF